MEIQIIMRFFEIGIRRKGKYPGRIEC